MASYRADRVETIARHIAPFGARIFVAVATRLPTRVLAWVLTSMFGMTLERLRVGTPA
jgi:hypothetical protein